MKRSAGDQGDEARVKRARATEQHKHAVGPVRFNGKWRLRTLEGDHLMVDKCWPRSDDLLYIVVYETNTGHCRVDGWVPRAASTVLQSSSTAWCRFCRDESPEPLDENLLDHCACDDKPERCLARAVLRAHKLPDSAGHDTYRVASAGAADYFSIALGTHTERADFLPNAARDLRTLLQHSDVSRALSENQKSALRYWNDTFVTPLCRRGAIFVEDEQPEFGDLLTRVLYRVEDPQFLTHAWVERRAWHWIERTMFEADHWPLIDHFDGGGGGGGRDSADWERVLANMAHEPDWQLIGLVRASCSSQYARGEWYEATTRIKCLIIVPRPCDRFERPLGYDKVTPIVDLASLRRTSAARRQFDVVVVCGAEFFTLNDARRVRALYKSPNMLLIDSGHKISYIERTSDRLRRTDQLISLSSLYFDTKMSAYECIWTPRCPSPVYETLEALYQFLDVRTRLRTR